MFNCGIVRGVVKISDLDKGTVPFNTVHTGMDLFADAWDGFYTRGLEKFKTLNKILLRTLSFA